MSLGLQTVRGGGGGAEGGPGCGSGGRGGGGARGAEEKRASFMDRNASARTLQVRCFESVALARHPWLCVQGT